MQLSTINYQLSTMLLQVSNLSVCYGAIRALHDVSLEIDRGEIVTLIGSNGAGKTTLLRTISGLLKPTDGSITWQADVPITGRQNLMLGAYQRTDPAEIKRNLDRCFSLFPVLAERRAQGAGTLSGGEQQMLAIARALMQCPKLLLLDEPSLGLAPLVVRKIFQIVREINREGV